MALYPCFERVLRSTYLLDSNQKVLPPDFCEVRFSLLCPVDFRSQNVLVVGVPRKEGL